MKNKYEIRGDITVIFIKHKGVLHEFLIDTSDLELVSSFPNTWIYHDGYAAGNIRYQYKKTTTVRMHRLITNAPKGMVVDHINHNPSDNRRINLRVVDQSVNCQNISGARKDNKSSGIRGVHKSGDKWVGKFAVDGKFYHVGRFDDKEEARIAVERARAKLMPGSIEALTMKIPENEEVLYDPNRPYITNKKSGIKNVLLDKNNRWSVVVKKVYYGSYDTLEEADKVARLARSGEIEPFPVHEQAYRSSKTGVRGVVWHSRDKKWAVCLTVNGKRKGFGYYTDFEDAVKKANEVKSTLR